MAARRWWSGAWAAAEAAEAASKNRVRVRTVHDNPVGHGIEVANVIRRRSPSPMERDSLSGQPLAPNKITTD